MSSSTHQQYAFRAQKQLGLIGGIPDYHPLQTFEKPEAFARTYQYSSDGGLLAFALPASVRITEALTGEMLRDIPVENAIEINFSPRGTFLATWERQIKLEDGLQHKNLRIWAVATGEEVASFSQKSQELWDLQYTSSESHAVRLSGPEIQVYNPADWSKGIVDKLRVEGVSSISLSPGLNPSVAVFIAEKKGAPASIRIYGLLSLAGPPTCQKTFYKADRSQIKWNALGTQALFMTQTEVDKTNKSYYGETGLYLLSAAGNFDCRVSLDKEGPIHDFAWSPNSKEFGVVYGYMPAKTVLFDQRVKPVHDFGSAPHNFISFNPQSRLVALAGFGNLAGKIDIHDRRSLVKVCTIDAPNTSFFQWSEDGKTILTATLSPRLRVDNGIKIWHCTGPLLHIHAVEDLYQASWRPIASDVVPPFGNNIPSAPTPSASVKSTPVKASADKPAGAYRPPGALGRAAPSIFKREDEGGAAHVPGTSTPPRHHSHSPTPNGSGHSHPNGTGAPRKRYVPGAPPNEGGAPGEKKPRKKRERREGERPKTAAPKEEQPESKTNGILHVPVAGLLIPSLPAGTDESIVSPGGESGTLDPLQKKARNLTKKLKAIEELKEKAKRGEKLEATQLKKMDGEQDIRKELAAVTLQIEQAASN